MTRSAAQRGADVRFPAPPVLFAAPLALTLALSRAVPWPVPGRPATALVGAALTIGGVAFSLSGAATVLRHRTTLAPHHAVSQLVTSGPFHVSRNPMYTGHVVAYVGAALWVSTWWPLLLVWLPPMLTQRLVIDPEERYLTQRFGPAYEVYRSRVRRWL